MTGSPCPPVLQGPHPGQPSASATDHTPRRLEAVTDLENRLQARRGKHLRNRLIWPALGAALAAAYFLYPTDEATSPAQRYETAKVERRDVVETVESSGKLRPVKEVQVGTQISGRVAKVHVDFNSTVAKGDLLAEIDPSLLGAQVHLVTGQLDTAKAQLNGAQAALRAALRTRERMDELFNESVISQTQLDDAHSAVEVAQADVVAARARIAGLAAQLEGANTTLSYTKIYSPIDGVIIDRAVDPGQTVASSFAAPVLFVIAQDLKAMQVLADIDEADVGKVSEGMTAKVSVDAFPGQQFRGTVTQLRYSPTEVQGVVTYAAVLDVPNEQLKLRPGMTATVVIETHRSEQALAVPNSALRFSPSKKKSSEGLRFDQRRLYLHAPSAATPPSPDQKKDVVPGTDEAGTEGGHSQGELTPQVVAIGITDGLWTELREEAPSEGTDVVVRENQPKKSERRKFLGIF